MLKMFNPTVPLDEIVDFIVDRIITAGPNPCPPITLGVGIGGTSEKAMHSQRWVYRG
jgi:fumarate hydratase subunit alpha